MVAYFQLQLPGFQKKNTICLRVCEERFDQRLMEYSAFWASLLLLCDQYCAEATRERPRTVTQYGTYQDVLKILGTVGCVFVGFWILDDEDDEDDDDDDI